jgi:hypothetical protein
MIGHVAGPVVRFPGQGPRAGLFRASANGSVKDRYPTPLTGPPFLAVVVTQKGPPGKIATCWAGGPV